MSANIPERPASCPRRLEEPLVLAGSAAEALASAELAVELMPGNENEAVALIDAYLERTTTGRRIAQLDS
jgi:hypothetical protein